MEVLETKGPRFRVCVWGGGGLSVYMGEFEGILNFIRADSSEIRNDNRAQFNQHEKQLQCVLQLTCFCWTRTCRNTLAVVHACVHVCGAVSWCLYHENIRALSDFSA